MRFRQWIIYSCCVLAGLILLAHAFVPHIHHDGGICFAKEHSLHVVSGHEQGGGDTHKQGHDHGPFEDCELNDLQIRPEVNESITPDLANRFSLNFHLIFLPDNESPVLYPAFTKRPDNPYLCLPLPALTGCSHSLRAPPAPFRA